MRGFAVQGYGGDDGDVDRHHFSVLCPVNLSVIETFDLPFEKKDSAQGGSCGSLLYFIGGFGRIVIWNSTTKQIIKVLDPPVSLPGYRFQVISTGLGYDAKSRDYKLVRHCRQKEVSTGKVQDSYFDLHSLKCGTSKKLKTPFVDMSPDIRGVYLMQTGCCYWEAWIYCLPDDKYPHCILSFDFATEIFDHFPLPDLLEPSDRCELVDVWGYLGLLVHRHIDNESFSLDVDVFVRVETVWYRIYAVNFEEHFLRPVGLKYGHLLFLEVKERGWCSQLMAYDLETETSMKLNIKVHRGTMFGISYAETTGISNGQTTGISYAETGDPYSIPVTMISPNKEEEEEEAEEKKTKKQETKKKKTKKKKKEKEKEKEKVKVKDQNRSHIPHSRTIYARESLQRY